MFDLLEKVVVVTGGAGLLGVQHAIAICSANGIPVLLDSDTVKLDLAKKKVENFTSTEVLTLEVDITDEEQVKFALNSVLSKYGRVDALINNAARNPKVNEGSSVSFTRLEQFSKQELQNDLLVGVIGAFLCTKYFGQKIAENANGGVIINICSDLAIISPDQRLYELDNLCKEKQPVKPISYSIVKTALLGMTRYTATYWAEKNVRCNALCPGGVNDGQSEIFLDRVERLIPLARMAKHDEYASTIVWMLSDKTSYLNGATIVVDGGRTIW